MDPRNFPEFLDRSSTGNAFMKPPAGWSRGARLRRLRGTERSKLQDVGIDTFSDMIESTVASWLGWPLTRVMTDRDRTPVRPPRPDAPWRSATGRAALARMCCGRSS
jgi:hypothetical protein